MLDVGQMIANGPYSGMEGNYLALRLSPGWRVNLNRGLDIGNWLALADGDDISSIPGSEPGVGGERDNPERGFLRWRLGRDGDTAHMELGLLQTTLGHGSAVRLYQNTPEGAPLAIGALAEGQINGGGLVLVLGDMFRPQRFFAARVRIKPLNWLLSPDSALEPNGLDLDPRGEVLGFIIVGATAAVDFEAPINSGAINADGAQVQDRGARPVATFGLDLEIPPIDMWVLHINPYVDGVMLMGRGDGPGWGIHPGISAGTNAIGLFWQLSFQYFFGSAGYKPWYFDGRYVFERLRTVGDGAPKGAMASPAPAMHGYTASLSTQLVEALTLWLEMGDQFPFDPADGSSYGRLRLGGTAGVSMANVTLSVAREGWGAYDRVFSDDGLTAVVLQGKLSLAIIALIARYTYSVERNLVTGERFEQSGFEVGTELAFGL